MNATFKSGKAITGKLAETFARLGIAKANDTVEGGEMPKKKGNIKNLKNQKKK
jgi:hypothetical protein